MTSPAIKAQGSLFKIASGAGGAETITVMTLSNPTILTSVAHALVEGDVVTLANFAGAHAADLNGKVVMVDHVTANTFSVPIDTTGRTIDDNTDAATATPVAYTTINGIVSFARSGGGAAEIDSTDLNSVAKEFLTGLVDYGEFSCEISWKIGDTGQNAVRTSLANGTTVGYQLTLTDASVATFNAMVKETPFSGGVDAKVSGSLSWKITGAIAWA